MIFNQAHDPLVAGIRTIAVFKVDRVDRAASTQVLQPNADDLRFGGVNHDRQSRASGQQTSQRSHVLAAITAHVVHAQVQHVGAVAGLLLGNIDACFPVPRQHCLAESLGTIGVGALANHGDARVLGQRDAGVQAGYVVASVRMPVCLDGGRGGVITQHGGADCRNVRRCRTTAAADHRQAIAGDKLLEGLGKLRGSQGVLRAVFTQDR